MRVRKELTRVGKGGKRVHALPPVDAAVEPTVGTIKRALHELSRAPSGSTRNDSSAMLREAHAHLLGLARSNGIDPDEAIRGRLAAVALLRERMQACFTAPATDVASLLPG